MRFLQEEQEGKSVALARDGAAFLLLHGDSAIKQGVRDRSERKSSVLPFPFPKSPSGLMISSNFSLVPIAVVRCQPVSTGRPPATL